MIALDKTIENIDNVLYFLENHREKAARMLFCRVHTTPVVEGYIQTWIELTPFLFWTRLDLGNRRRLVDMAREHYA
jgi:hypothetical protein